MRDIKFRAWNGNALEYGGFSIHATGEILPVIGLTKVKENSIIMQYTGFKDKNGVEIYEGDIVSYKTKFYGKVKEGNKQVIKWEDDLEHDGFGQPWATGFIIYGYDWEVIGNIYQNPELLKIA